MPRSSTEPEDEATRVSSEASLLEGPHPTPSGPRAPAREIGEGDALGRYLVLGIAGRGGMGIVYRAYDPRLRREVAIKLLRGPEGSHALDTEAEGRLLREAQAMAQLNHPNVLPVYDADRAADGLFIAMEYVEGQTLGKWLTDTPRSWREVVIALGAAGRGMAAAHAVGIVHRDFKPSNVLIRDDERVLVMDFGLATALDEEVALTETSMDSMPSLRSGELEPLRTRPGSVMGTPAYMSPEQHAGAASHVSGDQYSFCVALYEALYGERPFVADDYKRLVHAKHHQPPPSEPPVRAVPRRLHRAVLRGLAVDPKARWPDLATLLDELDACLLRRRRRAIVLGGGAALAAWGTSLAVASGGAELEPCAAEPERLAEIWSTTHAERIAIAFEETGLPFAESAWSRAAPGLDDYAQGLVDARREACLDTHVRRSQSATLLDRRMACLDRREQALGALVKVLHSPNAELVEHAVEAVVSLPPVEPCADPSFLLAEVEPPGDPATAEAVAQVRERLAEAEALGWADRFDEQQRLLDGLQTEAEALGYEPVLAELELERAQLSNEQGEYDRAHQQLADAFFRGLDAGHERVMVEAAVDLTLILGFRESSAEQGLLWARHARGLLGRRGDDVRMQARLQGSLSALHQEAGNGELALEHAQSEVEIYTEALGESSPQLATALQNLGNAYAAKRDPDSAITQFQRARDILVAAQGPDHPGVAVSHNGLGNALSMKGEHESAFEQYRRALEIWEAVLGEHHPKVASVLSNMALSLDNLGQAEESIAMQERALAINRRVHGPEHPTVAASLNGLGMAYGNLERWDEAIGMYDQAIEIWTKAHGPTHMGVAMAMGNKGVAFEQVGRLEDADITWSAALPVLEGTFGADHPLIATLLVDLARVQSGERKDALALENLERALEIREAKLPPDHPELAGVRMLVAEALESVPAQHDRARALVEQARDAWAAKPKEHEAELARAEAWLRRR